MYIFFLYFTHIGQECPCLLLTPPYSPSLLEHICGQGHILGWAPLSLYLEDIKVASVWKKEKIIRGAQLPFDLIGNKELRLVFFFRKDEQINHSFTRSTTMAATTLFLISTVLHSCVRHHDCYVGTTVVAAAGKPCGLWSAAAAAPTLGWHDGWRMRLFS